MSSLYSCCLLPLLLPLLLLLSCCSGTREASVQKWSSSQLAAECRRSISLQLLLPSGQRESLSLWLATRWVLNQQLLVIANQQLAMQAACLYQGAMQQSGEAVLAAVTDNMLRASFQLKSHWYSVLHRLDSNSPAVATPIHVEEEDLVLRCAAVDARPPAAGSSSNSGSSSGSGSNSNSGSSSSNSNSGSSSNSNSGSRRRRRSLKLETFQGAEPRKILEVLAVANTGFIRKNGGNTGAVTRILEIMNFVNGAYQPLSLRVVLKEVVLWSQDAVNATQPQAVGVLNGFSRYKADGSFVRHDIAVLFTSESWNPVLGLAYKSNACERIFGSVLVSDTDQQAVNTAWVTAHEIGHNLGFSHVEDISNCTCSSGGGCVMNSYLSVQTDAKEWATCSVEAWRHQVNAVWRSCLHDAPASYHDNDGAGLCGNGIVEAGEQCDCGPQMTCASNCCNATTCQLKAGAACASGGCCDWSSCQLRPRGSECRSARDACDLKETCSGASEWCPDDDRLADGVECRRGEAYCHKGRCQSLNSSCRLRLSAAAGDPQCIGLNGRGVFYGHCGFNLQSVSLDGGGNLRAAYRFLGCGSSDDNSCGQLQCSMPRGSRIPGSALVKIGNDIFCYTPPKHDFTHAGLRSPSLIPDGAACGDNQSKMCVNSRCVARPEFGNCSGHGVATRSGGCFCDRGFAPPDCAQPGCGGSVASPLVDC